MTDEPRHRMLREMLGAYALGHLAPDEVERIREHLDGCEACRADLADILPVARCLDAVHSALLESPPMPPSDLAERIRSQIARDRAADEADESVRVERGSPADDTP